MGRGFCFLSPLISPRASGACYARCFTPHRALLSFSFRDTARRVSLSQIVCARSVFTAAAAQRVIRGASRAGPYIGAQRGKCPPAAIWLYSHRYIGRARHKPERARQQRRIYRASVRASYTPGERRSSACGGILHCRTVPKFRIPHSACARHKPERARQLRRIYRASVRASYTPGERRLSVYGGIRHCRTVPKFRIPNSSFRISNQRWRGLRRPLP